MTELQKSYAAGLEIRCPGGVYFNRDNSQLAPILTGVMPSKCGLDHSEAHSFQKGAGLRSRVSPRRFTFGVSIGQNCGRCES